MYLACKLSRLKKKYIFVKKKMRLFLIISILGLFGCNPDNPAPTSQTYSVKYVVECTSLSNISYYDESQGVSQANGILGLWELDITLKTNDLAYISSNSSSLTTGNTVLKIFVNGVLEKQTTGSGPGAGGTTSYFLP